MLVARPYYFDIGRIIAPKGTLRHQRSQRTVGASEQERLRLSTPAISSFALEASAGTGVTASRKVIKVLAQMSDLQVLFTSSRGRDGVRW